MDENQLKFQINQLTNYNKDLLYSYDIKYDGYNIKKSKVKFVNSFTNMIYSLKGINKYLLFRKEILSEVSEFIQDGLVENEMKI